MDHYFKGKPFKEASALAQSVFQKHLKTLKGVSRSAEDWVNDTILHPWPGSFSIDIEEILDAMKHMKESWNF